MYFLHLFLSVWWVVMKLVNQKHFSGNTVSATSRQLAYTSAPTVAAGFHSSRVTERLNPKTKSGN